MTKLKLEKRLEHLEDIVSDLNFDVSKLESNEYKRDELEKQNREYIKQLLLLAIACVTGLIVGLSINLIMML